MTISLVYNTKLSNIEKMNNYDSKSKDYVLVFEVIPFLNTYSQQSWNKLFKDLSLVTVVPPGP